MDMYFELCSMYLCYCMVGFFLRSSNFYHVSYRSCFFRLSPIMPLCVAQRSKIRRFLSAALPCPDHPCPAATYTLLPADQPYNVSKLHLTFTNLLSVSQ